VQASSGRPSRLTLGAGSGKLAPALLALVFAALSFAERGFLQHEGWSPVHRTAVEWPSLLELGRYGWIETAAFIVSGVLGLAFAITLRLTLPTRLARNGASALGLMSVAVGCMAFHPDVPGRSLSETWHSALHNGIYPVIPISALIASICFALGLRHKPNWSVEARSSAGFLVVALLALGLTNVTSIAQLARYFLFGPLLIWTECLAIRTWRRSPHRS
jgi:hypothetical protein